MNVVAVLYHVVSCSPVMSPMTSGDSLAPASGSSQPMTATSNMPFRLVSPCGHTNVRLTESDLCQHIANRYSNDGDLHNSAHIQNHVDAIRVESSIADNETERLSAYWVGYIQTVYRILAHLHY